jgi:hypothetical protein
MLLIGDFIKSWLPKDSPVVQYGGITVIVLVVLILEWRYRRMKHKFLDKNQAVPSQSDTKPDDAG